MVQAVERLKQHGLSVYNQMVYTFFVSRRFGGGGLTATAEMRRRSLLHLRAQGKRVRLRRTGCLSLAFFRSRRRRPVFCLVRDVRRRRIQCTGSGQNHLLASQHRDIVSILPDGSRVYEFHPWEKNIVERESYLGQDVPILDYLDRLQAMGEDPDDYSTIWYYF